MATNQVSIMLTGVTGAGKSTACNFLFDETKFAVGGGLISITSKSAAHETVLNGRNVRLIDTPGFCDDFETNEEKVDEFGKAILLAKDGVHAIGLVIKVSQRFTSAEAQALEELELLGELWPFMFIIFTGAASCGPTDSEQRGAIATQLSDKRCPEDLKMLIGKVNRRFIMLESTKKDQGYRNGKVKEFFTMVDKIYSANQRLYTNYYFKKANELYQEAKRKEKHKEEELLKAHEKVTEMSAEMAKAMAEMRSEQGKQQILFQETLITLKAELTRAQEENKQLARSSRGSRCLIL